MQCWHWVSSFKSWGGQTAPTAVMLNHLAMSAQSSCSGLIIVNKSVDTVQSSDMISRWPQDYCRMPAQWPQLEKKSQSSLDHHSKLPVTDLFPPNGIISQKRKTLYYPAWGHCKTSRKCADHLWCPWELCGYPQNLKLLSEKTKVWVDNFLNILGLKIQDEGHIMTPKVFFQTSSNLHRSFLCRIL